MDPNQFIRMTVLVNSYKAIIKTSMTNWMIKWTLILVIIHFKIGYNDIIQIATTEREDIWSREINELYPINKQSNSRHKVQYDQGTLTSIGLRVQSDITCRRLDPELVHQIRSLRLNRRETRGEKAANMPEVN